MRSIDPSTIYSRYDDELNQVGSATSATNQGNDSTITKRRRKTRGRAETKQTHATIKTLAVALFHSTEEMFPTPPFVFV